MSVLNKPLTPKQGRARQNEEGYIKVVVSIDLCDLIDHDIKGLNDLVEEQILADEGILEDISYKVVGHTTAPDDGTGAVLIEVHACIVWNDEEE